MKKLIKIGAEALLYKKNNLLIKERICKGYRIQQIDNNLRKFRTRREVRLLEKSMIINVPKVHGFSDVDMTIEMDFINGKLLKNVLDDFTKIKRVKICKRIGEEIAKLHNNEIIHGDLTTSNMILKNDNVYFIDFGLGFFSNKIEDKAVDLHLLKHALESRHYKHSKESFRAVISGYKKSKDFSSVLKRLEKVGMRGRYKKK